MKFEKARTLNVGKIEGQEVTYDPTTYEFSVTINREVFKAKSFPALKRLVENSKAYKWLRVMELSYATQAPKRLKVTLRGNRYYIMQSGKLCSVDTYNLYKLDEEKFSLLTDLANKIRALENEFGRVKNSLKRFEWCSENE